ncbi:MAG: hypothetical protein IJ301_01055 [Clostridia bacterium]|nr:hypothetical protein [Clostridia bacterium]
MKQYDLVELISDKDKYKKFGVKKGDFGAVIEKVDSGKYQVIFSEFYTGKDIADIIVDEEDLLVHDFVPKENIHLKISKKDGFSPSFLCMKSKIP